MKELYQLLAQAIRFLSVDAINTAQSGHPGMPLGMADVATVLFDKHLSFIAKDPKWVNRDRFILSAGHGSMLQYALLYLTGYEDISLEDLKKFRQIHSKAAGHPEYAELQGIETTTGPLGQGVANAVGMALSEAMLAHRTENLIDHYTYVIAGDGCLMEGVAQEAISLAGHLRLHKLIILFDDNGITIDGSTNLATSENHKQRFLACGWNVLEVNGHDSVAIDQALLEAKKSMMPTMICCKTVIGFGAQKCQGTSKAHGSPIGFEERNQMAQDFNWSYEPFEIPQDVLHKWRSIGRQNEQRYLEWQECYQNSSPMIKETIEKTIQGTLSNGWKEPLHDYIRQQTALDSSAMATRKASECVLEVLNTYIPQLLGGSADLSGSNNTQTSQVYALKPDDFSGRYVHYGVREHAMAAIMNGIALYKAFVPYGGTFLTFSDYCRPAIRLSALMQQRVIYIMTHDSIGLGEDGPTHQPIEHLMSLRLIPNLTVFRPADFVETAECWELALENTKGPSVIALTRQKVPALRTGTTENKTSFGAYILKETGEHCLVKIFATGSEVSVACTVQEYLYQQHTIGSEVISMPCWSIFDQQSEEYKESILGDSSCVRVSIEAGVTTGWEKYVGSKGLKIGIDQFGLSGSQEDLWAYFGFTCDTIVAKIMKFFN